VTRKTTATRATTTTACLLALSAAMAALSASARAEEAVAPQAQQGGDRRNPFACLGGYQALTGEGYSAADMADELRALLGRIHEAGPPAAGADDPERAVDLCVAARLKARLGHGDAADYFQRAIAAAPGEPGYELFAGMYWAQHRGARRPLVERAEDHLYAGLRKLARLRARRRAAGYHDTVADWLHKQLLVLYQQDGLQLLPGKAYPQRSPALGLYMPGLAFSSQLLAAQDTRDFFYNNEMRQFTGEATFAASDLRAGRAFDDREAWDLARAPRRFETVNRLRLRHNLLGVVDLTHSYSFSPRSQIVNAYDPNAAYADVTVFQLGAGYDRTFSLYPLFDVRLSGGYRRGQRQGVVEFQPEEIERFDVIEARPSFSRFVGTDVVTLDLSYVYLGFQGRPGGVVDDRLRRRDIRGARLEYALYAPVLLPGDGGGWQRTPIRGWHFYAGAVDDRELWGLHTVVRRDLYGGTRFGGAGRLDITVQGGYSFTNTEKVNPNTPQPMVWSERGASFSSARVLIVPQLRIIDQEAIPGVPPARLGLGVDMLNLVFPLQVDRGLDGRRDYENVRAGTELWCKLFGTVIGGAALLVTAGYDFQYFTRLGKGLHLAHAALRLGWSDL
jgi:hypothetical protein